MMENNFDEIIEVFTILDTDKYMQLEQQALACQILNSVVKDFIKRAFNDKNKKIYHLDDLDDILKEYGEEE
jgi:hypothetical protein